MAGTDLEKHDSGESHAVATPHPPTYNPDAPSEQWGWHREWKQGRGSTILLVLFAVVILLMLFGNHVSNVENWYLLATGVFMFVWLGFRQVAARKSRRQRP